VPVTRFTPKAVAGEVTERIYKFLEEKPQEYGDLPSKLGSIVLELLEWRSRLRLATIAAEKFLEKDEMTFDEIDEIVRKHRWSTPATELIDDLKSLEYIEEHKPGVYVPGKRMRNLITIARREGWQKVQRNIENEVRFFMSRSKGRKPIQALIEAIFTSCFERPRYKREYIDKTSQIKLSKLKEILPRYGLPNWRAYEIALRAESQGLFIGPPQYIVEDDRTDMAWKVDPDLLRLIRILVNQVYREYVMMRKRRVERKLTR